MSSKKTKARLQNLETIEIKIRQKQEELQQIRQELDGEEPEEVAQLSADIKKELQALIIERGNIINSIHQLENPLYIDILYQRYIKYKSLAEIVDTMHYTERHIQRLHGYALQMLDEKTKK